MNFSDLKLIPALLKAAAEAGYETPSPIQQKAIPPVLAGRDLLGCAQTGTGKTAAFAMPILQNLYESMPPKNAKKVIRALILTPTRELALQIDESFADYGKHLPLKNCVIFGGVNQNPQVTKLKAGVDILTATPGRLNDLVGQGLLDLTHVSIFVLDEADRMLDMGFINDVKRVLRILPAQKQTLLFSATMPKEIEELANGLLKQPVKVMVTPSATTVEKIDQSLYYVDKGNKPALLTSLLKHKDVVSALVFTRTKHGADKVVRELAKDGITAMAIHGNKSQNARQDALARFKDGRIAVLIATDIAARGIDVSGLTHVINYELPNIPETYVHRIGRTGRAGQAGIAISFCDFDEKEYLSDIEKLIRMQIAVVEHRWPMKIFQKTEKKTQARPPREQRTGRQNPRAAHAEKSATAPMKKQNEGRKMEQKQPQQQTKPAQTGAAQTQDGAAAKRRKRRGGRRHGGGDKTAAGAQGANPAPANAIGNTPTAPKPAQKQAAPQRGTAPKPAPKAAPKSTLQAPPAVSDKDDSIQVISRKAPAQKYASFEDYMKAHE
ncbi:MAG: DEAD/DEAH box helicase [Ruthenibacterium sp.]